MGYLQSLTLFKTLFGRGAYTGAYNDYSALEEMFVILSPEKRMNQMPYLSKEIMVIGFLPNRISIDF